MSPRKIHLELTGEEFDLVTEALQALEPASDRVVAVENLLDYMAHEVAS